MRTLVVYESMFGNTHAIADSIADGLRPAGEVRVIPVTEAGSEHIAWAELVIAGGPTHVHGMTRDLTRDMARGMAAKADAKVTLDPAAAGSGIREWLDDLDSGRGRLAAAFDTRAQGAPFLTGRASIGISHGLRARGFKLVAEPESFLIDGEGHLVAGERDRARMWAAKLAKEPVSA
jgi:flavodoxin